MKKVFIFCFLILFSTFILSAEFYYAEDNAEIAIDKSALTASYTEAKTSVGPEFSVGFADFLNLGNALKGSYTPWFKMDFSVPKLPVMWSLGIITFYFVSNTEVETPDSYTNTKFKNFVSGLYFSADFWFLKINPISWFSFYLGAGADASLIFPYKSIGFTAAARMPIGLSFWPLTWLEPFIQFTLKLGLGYFYRYENNYSFARNRIWFLFNMDFAIGLRFWF